MTDHVAVFGATGVQGKAQLEALIEAGFHPIAISRSGPQGSTHNGAIESRAADFGSVDQVEAALSGSHIAFINLPSTSFQKAEHIIAGARVIALAARRVGVKQLIFNTSMPVPQDKLGFAAQDARHDMRAILFASGIPTTSLEPVVYLDNLLQRWAWPALADRKTLVYAHKPDLEVSWICHADLARLMIAAIDRPDLNGRCFPVGGRDTVCLPQLAAILSSAWNMPLAWESQSIEDFCVRMHKVFEGRATLDSATLVDELRRIYTWYNESPDTPFKVDMQPVLKELPVRLTPIDEWARAQALPD